MSPLLEVNHLGVEFTTDRGTVKAVDDLSYTIDHGETFGVVGESGAGKSVSALSVLKLIEHPGRITDGEILFKDTNLLELAPPQLREIRGGNIAMIFQDPMTSLNPAYTIGTQIVDVIQTHRSTSKRDARSEAINLLGNVDIPNPSDRIDEYPHQFSGGMRQRAVIAMALSCDPDLLIADEPTTALDVTIQAQILDLLDQLQSDYDLSIQLITHDMGVVSKMCDRVAVLYAGKKVEEGPTETVFEHPRHPYTLGLMQAIPRLNDPRKTLDTIPGSMPELTDIPSGCRFRDRCEFATDECAEVVPQLEETGTHETHSAACIRKEEIDFESEIADEPPEGAQNLTHPYQESKELVNIEGLEKYFEPETQSWFDRILGHKEMVHAVDDVSFSVREGETLGLVGESGCGKTTLARTIVQLYEPDNGTVVFAGQELTSLGKREIRKRRSDMQVIFQDPFSSLNPRKTVKEIIGRPLEIHGHIDTAEDKRSRVIELLQQVGLGKAHIDRYPHEFSGGQKQRIGIARALAVEPDFIVADEPVSALDVSVQAKIINLLMELQEEFGLTFLFIAHDLNVVQHISDRIAVMYLGEIVELGTVEELFRPPSHPYTEVLLSSILQVDGDEEQTRIKPKGEPPSPTDPPSGCRFHPRCPYAMSECSEVNPSDHHPQEGHRINCHLFDEEIMAGKEPSTREIIDQQFGHIDGT